MDEESQVRKALKLFLMRANEHGSLDGGSQYLNGQCSQLPFTKVMLINFMSLSKVVSQT